MTTACACSGGSSGAQSCGSDGTYGACDCGGRGVGGNGGAGGAGGSVQSGQKRVFVTSSKYVGSAVTGICQTVAGSVGLGGTWVEWLSYATNVTPKKAIESIKGAGPWVRLDGSVAFANHAQLATSPSVPLSLTERAQPVATLDDNVWTGTLSGGGASGNDCDDWVTTSNYGGSIGRATVADEWTAWDAPLTCNNTAHVYCFEQ